MFVKHANITPKDLGGGVTRSILAAGGTLMTVEFVFAKGSVGAMHSHPHEQVGYVITGSFEFTIAAEKTVLKAGDTYYVPANMQHGTVALEDGVLLDVFTPQREDFLG